MEHIRQTIREIDARIEKEAKSIKECRPLKAIPGIGTYSSLLISASSL